LIVAPVVIVLLWQIIKLSIIDNNPLTRSSLYNPGYFMAGFAALAVSITGTIYILFRKKTGAHNLTLGGLFVWLILVWLTSWYSPGASYLFTWPLLFNLIASGIVFALDDQRVASVKRSIIQSALAMPTIVIVAPFTCLFFASLNLDSAGMAMIVGVMVLVILLLLALNPLLDFLSVPNRWLAPGGALLVGVGLLLVGLSANKNGASNPKSDNVFYALNADSGKAIWASFDRNPDEWTSQFLLPDVSSGHILDYFPMMIPRGFLNKEAVAIRAPAPDVTVLNDSKENGVRSMRVRITSARKAPTIFVYVYADNNILSPVVIDKRITQQVGKVWVVQYYAAPDEGIELAFQIKSVEPIKIRAIDLMAGLPEPPGTAIKQRPANLAPVSSIYSDITLVNKTYVF
jgi:hypothetical protein